MTDSLLKHYLKGKKYERRVQSKKTCLGCTDGTVKGSRKVISKNRNMSTTPKLSITKSFSVTPSLEIDCNLLSLSWSSIFIISS